MEELRSACALIAGRARQVTVVAEAIANYAAALPPTRPRSAAQPDLPRGSIAERAAFWLTLDAVNFGSGWFPTLRKRDGRSGYFTIAAGIADRFARSGPWPARALAAIEAQEIATVLAQDPDHPLMALFASSLRDLGRHAQDEHGGSFPALATSTGGTAVALARRLGQWRCFADTARAHGVEVPFLKRAQIAAADLARAGVIEAPDLAELTMFADNLVPHVLRLDGILRFRPELLDRIEREELIEPGSEEEVEIRACALHAVELIVAAAPRWCAAEVDEWLWNRGQQPRYKAVPRHRCRCTAY